MKEEEKEIMGIGLYSFHFIFVTKICSLLACISYPNCAGYIYVSNISFLSAGLKKMIPFTKLIVQAFNVALPFQYTL